MTTTKERDQWQPVDDGFPKSSAVEIRLEDGSVRMAQWVVAKGAWLVGRTLIPPEAVTHWRPLHLRIR